MPKINWNNLVKELDEVIEEKEDELMYTNCSWENPSTCKTCRGER